MHTYRLRYYVHPGHKGEVVVDAPSLRAAVGGLPPHNRLLSVAARCEAHTKSAPHGQCAMFFGVDPHAATHGTRCAYHHMHGA